MELLDRRIYIAPLDAGSEVQAFCHAKALAFREKGIRVETTNGEYSLSKHLKKANQTGASFVMIVGPDEVKKGRVALKNMTEKTQTDIEAEKVVSYMQGAFQS